MRLEVAPEVFALLPGLTIAVVAAPHVATSSVSPAVVALWRSAWTDAGAKGAKYGNAQSHPRVKTWRETWQRLGISNKQYPSSIEALLRRALKGGEPFSISPLVDFYNAISLRHTVPAGAFDSGQLDRGVELRLTRPGDTFTALDAEQPEPVPPGEIAYASGSTVLTRHIVWRQARTGLVTPQTRDVFFVSEVLGPIGHEIAAEVASDLHDGLRTYFDTPSQAFLLDAERPAAEW